MFVKNKYTHSIENHESQHYQTNIANISETKLNFVMISNKIEICQKSRKIYSNIFMNNWLEYLIFRTISGFHSETVAACLRSLRTNDPPNKRHYRTVNKLKTQDWKLYLNI